MCCQLGPIGDVTHVVFGAYIEKPTAAEKSAVNVAIMRNLLDVVEATSPGRQAPVMKYSRDLMMAILWDRMPYLGEVVNTEIIKLEDAPHAYGSFSDGAAKKFVIDPHGSMEKAA